jgi:hypothetical protein
MRPELVDATPPPVTMSGRAILFAQCDRCDWQAKMTGDTEDEVERFLQRVVDAHVIDCHSRGVS